MQELYTALAKAQSEMPIIGKNKAGRFKYADLAEIIYVAMPILTKNGLSVEQDGIRHDDGNLSIKTVICHNSGQKSDPSVWPVPLPIKEELKGMSYIQAYMSNVTYIKRYSLATKLCIGISDEDYDGSYEVPSTPQTKPYNSPQPLVTKISPTQLNEILHHIGSDQDIVKSIYKKYDIESLADLPVSHYRFIVDKILEIKRAKESQ
jgi:hypothetical protein